MARTSRLGTVHYSLAASGLGLLIGAAMLATFGTSGTAGKSPQAVASVIPARVAEGNFGGLVSGQLAETPLAVAPHSDISEPVSQVSATPAAEPATTPPVATVSFTNDECSRLLCGTWTQEYHGQRTLTVRDDGSATLVVAPNKVGALLFGPRLQFEAEWSVDEGRAIIRITDGVPADKTKLARKLWGDRWNQPILELTESRLLLLDDDGQTKYDWSRTDGNAQ